MRLDLLLIFTPFVIAKVSGDENDKVVVGYYVPWGKVQPNQLNYDKVTHINYGFGVLTKKDDPASIFIDPFYDGNAINKLKELARPKGVKIQMSIGGWTGSQTFSLVARDPALRQKFINNALVFVRKNTKTSNDGTPNGWDLDGIDIDWEYPGRAAAVCNVYDAADSANYLLLLKELRAALDKEFPNEHKLLTAAVRVQPFDGPNGTPLPDVSQYAQYFDFINVMAYDINGDWPWQAWLNAKWPANKLVMGLPFYGRSLTAKVDMNSDPSNQYVIKEGSVPRGDPTDSLESNSFCRSESTYGGLWAWKYLRSQILTDGPTSPVAGWSRYWDNTTQTPWLFSASSKTYISYDDPQSLRIKVDYTKQQGLRGVMFWDITNDLNDELLDTLQAIRDSSSITNRRTTTSKIAKQISSNPLTEVNLCANASPWRPEVGYGGTQKVIYRGRLWQVKWQNKGDTPGEGARSWSNIGACN
ncbi:hypothetical protein K493DRAFT_297611 [Basidiobolus meristosporus CBS 931.73]|uniref:GH18 domain-containing protein n=1 Tax=Basidiobolus meristosporus CBS 931.73 TaxID=1314790 RepID=A0A1Y1YZ24_9FUNG|nr:hypothetical protein K493DRAFT_297611 [Basidiobolus meristosporus CBS 931.73]|eukprot:ORY03114.1 hypothetical protein K493DRAFT_297611 [Basidiobolus meristosporus CBS 931.73]